MTARPSLRLVHTSDLHLGEQVFPGCEQPTGDQCSCLVAAVAATAADVDADVLIIAGDLFDHARAARNMVAPISELFAALPFPVVLLPGNHDTDYSNYTPAGHEVLSAASNLNYLREMDGQLVEVIPDVLHVWGRANNDHNPKFKPLAGAPPRPERGWYVAVGHGQYIGPDPGTPSMRSSPITDEDITALDVDYVALGHWHAGQEIAAQPLTWYAGSPSLWQYSGSQKPPEVAVVDLHDGRPPAFSRATVDMGARTCAGAIAIGAIHTGDIAASG